MTRPLTFLFTDLEGSSRLWQQYPEAMKTALARHDELVRTARRWQKSMIASQKDLRQSIYERPNLF